jgi:hypothetical protein
MLQVTQVAVFSQTNTKHINTVWKERRIVKIFNFLVHPVTSWLLKVKGWFTPISNPPPSNVTTSVLDPSPQSYQPSYAAGFRVRKLS